jgi:hypothetical protein
MKLARALILFLSTVAVPATAQEFSVNLGGSKLGSLVYARGAGGESVTSTLDHTPLGVFDGTFKGTSRPAGGGREFVGVSRSSRKGRRVQVQIDGGRAVAVAVTPPEELTELSDPARAPAGVVDPVAAIGLLVAAQGGCPGQIGIYDGRRAIALVPEGQATEDGLLRCDIAYRVVAGPGHLSPLKIKSARMRLTYGVAQGRQELREFRLSSGIFTVVLARR